MSHKLRLSILALLLLLGTSAVQAQTVLAGQVAGATYVDLVPDKVMEGSRMSAASMQHTEILDSLDLNGDGIFDLRLRVFVANMWAVGMPGDASCRIMPAHANIQVPYSLDFYGYALTKRLPNDTIQAVLGVSGGIPKGVWHGGPSTIYNNSNFTLAEVYYGFNSPVGAYYLGFWGDGQDGYLPVRMRATASAAWQYGWVRMQVLPDATGKNTFRMSLIIKGYVLPTSLMTPRPADWQIYPTQVTDHLVIAPPAVAGDSYVTIRDLYGRLLLSMKLSGSRQLLPLAALGTGIYLVQLDTPTGRITRRITKQ